MKIRKCTIRAGAAAFLVTSTPAFAELPGPVRAMVDAAIETGDPEKVKTVIELARQTNPDEGAELDALQAAFAEDQAKLAEQEAKEEELAIRNAGLLDKWSGSGEIGAFLSSGNSSETGLTLGLKLKREGIDWSHELRVKADYQRTNGVTSREQIVAAYEPHYQIAQGLFAYALGQYERDRFQGFSARYAISAGLGYKLVDSSRLQISAKAGPAYRHTEFEDGTSAGSIAGLAGLEANWQITDRLKLTQDANMMAETGGAATVIFDSTSTSVVLVTGLEAKVSDRLTTRMSFTLDYDSNPPAGSVSTDTLSRLTLIYGF